MFEYPAIDPVAFSLGPLKVHWYGLMYLLGFSGAWGFALRRSSRPWSPLRRAQVEDLIIYSAFGVILGGRLGYVVLYDIDRWLSDPLWLLRLWEGGMSFHGGLLGVITAIWFYSRKVGQSFFAITDFAAPLAPIGLGFGRIGNFIGQELWGRPTESVLGMVFPNDPDQLPRHASQLYQAVTEGLILFVVLFWFSRKPRPTAAVSGLFLVFYSIFRFCVEFVREPDSHIGFDLLGWMTRGQLLCVPMFILGGSLLIWAYFLNSKVTESKAVKVVVEQVRSRQARRKQLEKNK
ncbi:MAG: prolipoprotein diacylglyceryl transferase [Pseudomonadales bacterium]|nr:prolipoprotein diacylglyceryl transferase [Pseudomonadales bacterium]